MNFEQFGTYSDNITKKVGTPWTSNRINTDPEHGYISHLWVRDNYHYSILLYSSVKYGKQEYILEVKDRDSDIKVFMLEGMEELLELDFERATRYLGFVKE